MKPILLVLGLVTVVSVHSQLDKGSKIIGIQTTLTKGNTYATYFAMSSKPYALYSALLTFEPGSNDYGVNISPTFGYALKRNWLIGAQAALGLESIKTNSSLGFSEKEPIRISASLPSHAFTWI